VRDKFRSNFVVGCLCAIACVGEKCTVLQVNHCHLQGFFFFFFFFFCFFAQEEEIDTVFNSETAVVKATRTDLLPPKEKWVRGMLRKKRKKKKKKLLG
jgi:hypothetical protein